MSDAESAYRVPLWDGWAATIFSTTSGFLWPSRLRTNSGDTEEIRYWVRLLDQLDDGSRMLTACLTKSRILSQPESVELRCRHLGPAIYNLHHHSPSDPVSRGTQRAVQALMIHLLANEIRPTIADYGPLVPFMRTPPKGAAVIVSKTPDGLVYLSESGEPPLDVLLEAGDELVACAPRRLTIKGPDCEGMYACDLSIQVPPRARAPHLILIGQTNVARLALIEGGRDD